MSQVNLEAIAEAAVAEALGKLKGAKLSQADLGIVDRCVRRLTTHAMLSPLATGAERLQLEQAMRMDMTALGNIKLAVSIKLDSVVRQAAAGAIQAFVGLALRSIAPVISA